MMLPPIEGQIDNPLTLNLYTYVHNNPLTYIDPTGHWCTSADGKWSHPGGCNDGKTGQERYTGTGYSADYWHNGDMIYENGKEVGIYEHKMEGGVHEDNSWTGIAFDIVVTGGAGGLVKIISTGGKKLLQKALGLAAEEVAVKIAYQGTRNIAVDFMNKKGQSTLSRHFADHAAEFGFKAEAQYLSAARTFVSKKATKSTEAFTSVEGTYFRYDTVTNEFGIINKFGGISTYMKPIEGLEYWLEQVARYAPK